MSLVRRGDARAFEVLYGRHVGELLSFARHMLGSPQDAEDAVQSTFASAYKALLANAREVDVRPWLFAIARNACLSILRQRRPTLELVGATASRTDPAAQVEQREDLRQALTSLLELPERQRAALILAELHGLSHSEIGTVLEVRADQVKSYVYQARSSLSSERRARGADCHEIREELAVARGAALLQSHLRRHLRSCPGCRAYSQEISRQRRALGLMLPLAPSLALKRRALEAALGRTQDAEAWITPTAAGASVAGSAADLVGGGASALLVKLLAGMACLAAAGTSVAASVTSGSATQRRPTAPAAGPRRVAGSRLAASVGPVAGPRLTRSGSRRIALSQAGASTEVLGSRPPAPAVDRRRQQAPPAETARGPGATKRREVDGKGEEPRGSASRREEPHGKSEQGPGKGEASQGSGHGEEPHGGGVGKAEEPHGRSEEAPGKGEEAHGRGNSEEVHGNSEEPHGKSEEPHGKSEESHGKSEESHGRREEPSGKGEEAHGPGAGGETGPGKSEETHRNGGSMIE